MMIRITIDKAGTLQYIQVRVGEDIVDAQCGGYIDIGSADAESLFQKGVLPFAADIIIGIGIGDVIEVAADDPGIGTFVELFPDLHGLIRPMSEGITELLCDGFGGSKNAVVHVLDNLYIMKVLASEEDGLEMGGKDPDRVIPDPDVGGDEAFGRPDPIGMGITQDGRVHDRVTGENDNARLVHAIAADKVAGKEKIREMKVLPDIVNIGKRVAGRSGLIKLLETKDIRLQAIDKRHHFHPMSRSVSLFGNARIEAAYIPGHQTQGLGSFLQDKTFPRVYCQEAMDIGPADHQGDQGNQGPEPMGGKENADNEKTA